MPWGFSFQISICRCLIHLVLTGVYKYITVIHVTEGTRHDAVMLRMSGLLNRLRQTSYSSAGQPLCIYGDPAYPLKIQLQASYRSANLTGGQEAFNKSMSDVRSAVECVFKDILSYYWTTFVL